MDYDYQGREIIKNWELVCLNSGGRVTTGNGEIKTWKETIGKSK